MKARDRVTQALDSTKDHFGNQLLAAIFALADEIDKRTGELNEETNLRGDDCFTGRGLQSNESDTKSERIIVKLPYGEHQFIAYDSDNLPAD